MLRSVQGYTEGGGARIAEEKCTEGGIGKSMVRRGSLRRRTRQPSHTRRTSSCHRKRRRLAKSKARIWRGAIERPGRQLPLGCRVFNTKERKRQNRDTMSEQLGLTGPRCRQ